MEDTVLLWFSTEIKKSSSLLQENKQSKWKYKKSADRNLK
jgi:hypothetical protein